MNGYTYSAQFESANFRWRGEVRDPDGRLVVRTSPTFSDPQAAIAHVERHRARMLMRHWPSSSPRAAKGEMA